MAGPDALRFQVCVGPRSPLHGALMALPAQERAAALLRWAEVGGTGGAAGPQASPSSTPSAEVAPLATAMLRLTAAVERLAAGRDAEPSGSDESRGDDGTAERAARLDGAWGG